MSKIIKIKTEHSYEIKTLFDVLKEILNEIKIDFIRDTDIPQLDIKSKKKSENDKSENDKLENDKSENDESENDESENDESENDESENDESEKKNNNNIKYNKNKKIIKKQTKKVSDNLDDNKNKSKIIEEKQIKKSNVGGIRILALDEHQTLLIYVKLNSDQFVEFYVKPQCHSIGLDLIQFHKFMKTVDKDSIMTIYIDKDDEQNIVFELQNNAKNNNATYKQKLLDIDDNTKKLPQETNFEMSVMMDTADFKKICTEMNQFSEYVEITCTTKEITFKCQGDSSAYVKIFKNSDTGVRIAGLKNNGKTPCIFQAIYNLKHLVTFGKCTNLCTEMQLYLKNDYPLFIQYTIGLLGKMLVGLSPVDEKAIKKDNDYDDSTDKYYNNKKVTMKEV